MKKRKRFWVQWDFKTPAYEVSELLIDEINDDTKELIIMDRRIFFDDRRIKDEDIDYRIVNLEAFSSNKNPSILLGSLYLIGEYKRRITTWKRFLW